MAISLPFLTAYDPPGTSEGTLDPLGLYQIADQLAVQLVPAIRERMQRVRFLTAMAVGALVTEDLEEPSDHRDASPFLVWEWLIVQALIKEGPKEDESLWGIPGTLVTRRALKQHGYLDARSYLKTPRIFGIHGVYKRLAIHLGVVDVRLGRAAHTDELVDAWARDQGYGGIAGARQLLLHWNAALRRSLEMTPPSARPPWRTEDWKALAQAFDPSRSGTRERKCLGALLHSAGDRALGALPTIWQLQDDFSATEYREELLHERVQSHEPKYAPLLTAIRSYETFARCLHDAWDTLRSAPKGTGADGVELTEIAREPRFLESTKPLNESWKVAHETLGDVALVGPSLQGLFSRRFEVFGQPMDAVTCAREMCTHHESIQRQKSETGKRPWFERLGGDRIFIRSAYREEPRENQPGRYVHYYRGWPIRRFHEDLT